MCCHHVLHAQSLVYSAKGSLVAQESKAPADVRLCYQAGLDVEQGFQFPASPALVGLSVEGPDLCFRTPAKEPSCWQLALLVPAVSLSAVALSAVPSDSCSHL